jgi:hypothetical protein
MKRIYFITVIVALISASVITTARAQVSMGSLAKPQTFSALELFSNHERGLRLPQMTTAQRNAMQATDEFQQEKDGRARGLRIFNTTTRCINTWNGLRWMEACSQPCGSAECEATLYPADVTKTVDVPTITGGTLTFLTYNLGACAELTPKQQMAYRTPFVDAPYKSQDATVYGGLFQWGRIDYTHATRCAYGPSTAPDYYLGGSLGACYRSEAEYKAAVDAGTALIASSGGTTWIYDYYGDFWGNAEGPAGQGITNYSGQQNRYNPCPEGFRIPTQYEWASIGFDDGQISNTEADVWSWYTVDPDSEEWLLPDPANPGFPKEAYWGSGEENNRIIWISVVDGKPSYDWDVPDPLHSGLYGTVNYPRMCGYALYTPEEWAKYDPSKLLSDDAQPAEPLMFLPAAGLRSGGSGAVCNTGYTGSYWSSTLSDYGNYPVNAPRDPNTVTAESEIAAENVETVATPAKTKSLKEFLSEFAPARESKAAAKTASRVMRAPEDYNNYLAYTMQLYGNYGNNGYPLCASYAIESNVNGGANCISSGRSVRCVADNPCSAPTIDATMTFCYVDDYYKPEVSELIPAPSATITWYDASNGSPLDPSDLLVDNGQYYCIYSDGDCTSPQSKTMTVDLVSAFPDDLSMTGPDVLYLGATNQVYSIPAITNPNVGTVYYCWQIPEGCTITSGEGTNSITIDVAGDAPNYGSFYLYVEVYNDYCEYQTVGKYVSVLCTGMLPDAPTGADVTICGADRSYTYYSLTATPPPGSTVYWYSSQTAQYANRTGNTLQGSLYFVSSVTWYAESRDDNGCISATRTPIKVTKYAPPSQPIEVSSATTVCPGATVVYSVQNVSGVTYNWELPPGWTQTSGGTTNSIEVTAGTSGGTIKVTPINSYGCSGTAQTWTITVRPVFTAGVIASTGQTLCEGETPTTIGSTKPASGGNGAITYRWKRDNSVITSTNSATYTPPSTLSAGTYTYTREARDVSCQTSFVASTGSWVLTVTAKVTPSVSIAATATTVTSGTSVTFTATPANGGTPSYQWKLNGNNVGDNSATYTTSSLVHGDQISCVMTTSLTCVTATTATSNTIPMTVTYAVPPTQPAWGTTRWVGAFWRDEETGERIIASANTGAWSATVDDPNGSGRWLTLQAGGSADQDIWTSDTDEAENYQLPATRVTSISGSGNILFRIGATEKNPASASSDWKYPDNSNGKPPRYATITLTVGGIGYKLFCRQGEAADYVFTTTDTYDSSTPRSAARKFSPYNLTGANLNNSDNLSYQVGARGGSFVDFPTKAGAFFQWEARTQDITRAYHPTNPPGQFPSWDNSRPSSQWDDIKSAQETCPTGFWRPNDGATDAYSTGDIANSEFRQSLYLTPPTGANNNSDNIVWGYYADGYFDRRQIVASVDEVASSAVSPDTKDVGYQGTLFVNTSTKASLFMPWGGERLGGNLLYAGERGYYFTCSTYGYDYPWHLRTQRGFASMGNEKFRTDGNSIRCVAE